MDILKEAKIVMVDSKDECDKCDLDRPSQSAIKVDRAKLIIEKAIEGHPEFEPTKLCQECYIGWQLFKLEGLHK
jgi:hypothetical protein